jgi:hypothetical protein
MSALVTPVGPPPSEAKRTEGEDPSPAVRFQPVPSSDRKDPPQPPRVQQAAVIKINKDPAHIGNAVRTFLVQLSAKTNGDCTFLSPAALSTPVVYDGKEGDARDKFDREWRLVGAGNDQIMNNMALAAVEQAMFWVARARNPRSRAIPLSEQLVEHMVAFLTLCQLLHWISKRRSMGVVWEKNPVLEEQQKDLPRLCDYYRKVK